MPQVIDCARHSRQEQVTNTHQRTRATPPTLRARRPEKLAPASIPTGVRPPYFNDLEGGPREKWPAKVGLSFRGRGCAV